MIYMDKDIDCTILLYVLGGIEVTEDNGNAFI